MNDDQTWLDILAICTTGAMLVEWYDVLSKIDAIMVVVGSLHTFTLYHGQLTVGIGSVTNHTWNVRK
jgi:hypothetical protein